MQPQRSPSGMAGASMSYGLIWLAASEHLNNMTNIGLDVGSDSLRKAGCRIFSAGWVR